jgi:cytochrome c oxidase subunit 2
VAEGAELAKSLGCSTCHSVDGSRRTGPTWLGLYGGNVSLKDGTTVVVDDLFIRRSIEDPAAEVVDGFSPIMPTFDLSDDDLSALTAYIRSLGST